MVSDLAGNRFTAQCLTRRHFRFASTGCGFGLGNDERAGPNNTLFFVAGYSKGPMGLSEPRSRIASAIFLCALGLRGGTPQKNRFDPPLDLESAGARPHATRH